MSRVRGDLEGMWVWSCGGDLSDWTCWWWVTCSCCLIWWHLWCPEPGPVVNGWFCCGMHLTKSWWDSLAGIQAGDLHPSGYSKGNICQSLSWLNSLLAQRNLFYQPLWCCYLFWFLVTSDAADPNRWDSSVTNLFICREAQIGKLIVSCLISLRYFQTLMILWFYEVQGVWACWCRSLNSSVTVQKSRMFKCIWDMDWWRIVVEHATCKRSKLVLGDCSGCAWLSFISCLQMATDHNCVIMVERSLDLTSGYFCYTWLFAPVWDESIPSWECFGHGAS